MIRNITYAVLGVILVCSTPALRADTVDSIQVNNAIECGIVYSCATVGGANFSFSIPASGAPVAHFTNTSGISWPSLILTETGVPAIEITCTSNLFGCTVVPYGTNGAKIIFRAGRTGGIGIGKSFEIGCVECAGLTFTGNVGIAPEPPTYFLLLTGLLLLVFAGRARVSSWL